MPRWLNRRRPETPRRRPIALEWLLLGAVVLYALQAIYSTDHTKAAENIAFFYIPFGLLFMLLRDVHWTRELILKCLGVAVALAVVFAGIGFVEYYRKTLFLNPKVIASNQYGNYFRVNSLFFDPNIYGRFLAIVMIAVTTVVLWARRRREVLIGAGVLAWLLGGVDHELLAIEHRGAVAGDDGARRLPLGRARDPLRCGSAAGDRRWSS